MIKVYEFGGRKYRFEEGDQPEGAKLVEAKVKVVVPETKIVVLPEVKAEPKTTKRKSTKKG